MKWWRKWRFGVWHERLRRRELELEMFQTYLFSTHEYPNSTLKRLQRRVAIARYNCELLRPYLPKPPQELAPMRVVDGGKR